MNINRLLLGFFGVGLAGLFFVNALDYPKAAAQMPLIYSVTVILLSVAMIATEIMRKYRPKPAQAEASGAADESPEETDTPRRYGAVAIVFALAIAYVLAITTLGYLLATALFMGLALLVIRTVSVTFALVGTLVLTIVVCLVFIQFLGLPVPLLPAPLS